MLKLTKLHDFNDVENLYKYGSGRDRQGTESEEGIMAKFCRGSVIGDLEARSQLAEAWKVSGRKVSKCSFTIDSILGLKKNEKVSLAIKPHRPWADVLGKSSFPGTSCLKSSQSSSDLPATEKEDKCCDKEERRSEDRFSYPPNCCWFRGRRPRTAFSRTQIEVLEEEFRLNCYPGIDVREALAQKLALDEDRIQVVIEGGKISFVLVTMQLLQFK
ncbi:homeobox expressed in ES cells 1 [Narcine bancroftii]|uniref:homeobox expressed in ES cells 1 n=1 Tax=Narcine bancroftii TaxID=1343680 RepID=UPI00383129EC